MFHKYNVIIQQEKPNKSNDERTNDNRNFNWMNTFFNHHNHKRVDFHSLNQYRFSLLPMLLLLLYFYCLVYVFYDINVHNLLSRVSIVFFFLIFCSSLFLTMLVQMNNFSGISWYEHSMYVCNNNNRLYITILFNGI